MKPKEIKMVIAAGCALLALVGTALYSAKNTEKEVKINSADLCPADRSNLNDYAAILLDISDPLTDNNAKELSNEILKIAEKIPKYGKLALFNVNATDKPFFFRCLPNKPSECDPLHKNCGRVSHIYGKEFEEPVKNSIEKFLANAQRQETSPIIEAIYAISLLTDFQEKKTKELYIFSDMLQNVGGYSHYDGPTHEEFQKLSRTEYYKINKPVLNGISVEVFYILNRGPARTLQTENHRLFWDDFFKATGATQLKITNWNFGGSVSSK